ncbi:MAG: hypothetical protein ACRC4W_03580, partial [Treponemataceae bacterium]
MVELRNVPFMNQWEFIQLIVDTLDRFFYGAAFDSRGNGQMIAEMAAQEYAGVIFEVMLSRKWYAENFPHLRGSIEEKTFIIPDDKDLKADFST